ncbi:MAG: beta strand repeat-containing protein [Verrucomicrobiota bacterium JB025]|nr:hypothetical protein [Verrucomicrobiota bacterium JB025]
MKPRFAKSTFALALVSLTGLSSTLTAQTAVTWDGAGDGSTYEDGGNWGGTAPADDLTTNIATFTGGTVDLSTTRLVAGLNFSSASTLSGSGSIEIGASGIAVGGDSVISTAGFTSNTSAAVTLDGTLEIGSALIGTGDITFTAGTASGLTLSGTSGDDNSSSYSGNLTFDGVNATVSRYALGGGQSGKTLSILNGATLNANGNHLVLGNRDIVISGGATIQHARNRNIYRFEGVISGTDGLTYGCTSPDGAGSGKIQLDGTANTYTGGTTFGGGSEVWVTADGSLGAASEGITFNNGTFYAKSDMTLTGRAITLDTGGGRFDGGTGARVTIDSAISDGTTPGLLTADSGGILRISTSGNTYSGGTMIDGSTVEVRNSSGGVLGTGTITLDNGGKIEGSANHVNLDGITSIVIGDNGGTFQNAHGRAFYNLGGATISGTGVLTLEGGGSTNANSRIQIGGMNNTLTTGLVMQNSANVQVSNDSDLGIAGSKVTLDNARFVSTDGGDYGTREFEITSGGGTLALDGATTTMSGALTGTGALAINGEQRNYDSANIGGTLIMHSTGTLTGDVSVDGVGIEMSADNSLGTGTVTLDNGARLKNRDSDTVFDNDLLIGSGGGELMAGWNKSLTLNGIISGTGPVTIVSDSGTVTFAGANTYSGETTVDAATLAVTGSSIPDAGTLSLTTGAVVNVTGTETVSALNLAGIAQAEGTYGATGSGADNIDDTYFTGTGVIEVTSLTGYAGWAATNAGNQSASEDFDGDGTPNGVEYFINAAVGFNAKAQLDETNTISWINGGNIAETEYGTQFVVQTSTDLVNWTDVDSSDPNLVNLADSLSYTLSGGETAEFIRLMVMPQ